MLYLCLFTFFFFFDYMHCSQFYDPTACSSPEFSPGSLYTCSATLTSCKTYIVYRSHEGFNSISKISELFRVNESKVLSLNNIFNPSQKLDKNREVLLPATCFCLNGYFQSNVSYTVPSTTTYAEIACNVFQGLVKLVTLAKENSYHPSNLNKGLEIHVPLKCACPDINDTTYGYEYLVSYPIQERDNSNLVAKKFNITLEELIAQNSQGVDATVISNTTILVPVKTKPIIDWRISDPSDQNHTFIPLSPSQSMTDSIWNSIWSSKKKYIFKASVALLIIFIMFSAIAMCYKARNRRRHPKFGYLNANRSTPSCLSPDMLAVMAKYSLNSYTTKEVNAATNNFSKEMKLGASVHKGRIGESDLVIKKMGFGDARKTISIHSKINHSSIVKLDGVCYGDDEFSSSYLVFEYARNGSLRNCLQNKMEVLTWQKRAQIALDVAMGLQYIHHCTTPSYIHMNISSKNILLTEEYRAKIANLGLGYDVIASEGWVAPEYIRYGFVSTKIDVFAFGVVLFEILSAKEVRDKNIIERLCFLNGEGGALNGCFDELKMLIDPNLDDYPIGDALCMTVLAKCCLDENPMHRPSMNDVMKVLSRMVR